MKYSTRHIRSRFIISLPPIKEIYKFLINQLYDKIVENFELRLYNAEGNFMKSKFVCLSSILFGLVYLSAASGLYLEPILVSEQASKNAIESNQALTELANKAKKQFDIDATNSERKISSVVLDWTQKYIHPHIRQYDTVFYPFGYSDIEYALAFFPQAKRYVFISVEPFEKKVDIDSHPGFVSLISKVLQLGYNINNIAFTSDKKRCIHINCSKRNNHKEIFYIYAKLDDNNLPENYLMKFLQQFEFVTFLKNANYALHYRKFSQIRNFIQMSSSAIVQDDSGIPFNAFRSGWICHFFENYSAVGANAGYAHKKQDIKNLFKQKASIEMPFSIQGFNERSPNLLIAISEKKISEQMNKLRQQMTKKKCNCKKNRE